MILSAVTVSNRKSNMNQIEGNTNYFPGNRHLFGKKSIHTFEESNTILFDNMFLINDVPYELLDLKPCKYKNKIQYNNVAKLMLGTL